MRTEKSKLHDRILHKYKNVLPSNITFQIRERLIFRGNEDENRKIHYYYRMLPKKTIFYL